MDGHCPAAHTCKAASAVCVCRWHSDCCPTTALALQGSCGQSETHHQQMPTSDQRLAMPSKQPQSVCAEGPELKHGPTPKATRRQSWTFDRGLLWAAQHLFIRAGAHPTSSPGAGSKAATGASCCRTSHTRTAPSLPQVATSGGPQPSACRQQHVQLCSQVCAAIFEQQGQRLWPPRVKCPPEQGLQQLTPDGHLRPRTALSKPADGGQHFGGHPHLLCCTQLLVL